MSKDKSPERERIEAKYADEIAKAGLNAPADTSADALRREHLGAIKGRPLTDEEWQDACRAFWSTFAPGKESKS